MAAKKRATRRGSGKTSGGGLTTRFSGTKKHAPTSRKKGEKGALAGLRRIFSREVLGSILIVTGLFFTMAFLSNAGAFLGEAGRAAVTGLLGLAGYALPPLAALAGLLLLLRRVPYGRSLGAALILLAVATTLAIKLSPELRFDASAYPLSLIHI